jgi:hypothetical protein
VNSNLVITVAPTGPIATTKDMLLSVPARGGLAGDRDWASPLRTVGRRVGARGQRENWHGGHPVPAPGCVSPG